MRRVAIIGFAFVLALVVLGCGNDKQVPNVTGQQLNQARQVVETAGLTVRVIEKSDAAPAGTVIAQQPLTGTVAEKSTVTVTVSKGAAPVEVPNISGMIDPAPLLARQGLKGQGIPVEGAPEPDAGEAGVAYRQDPQAGTLVPAGTTVTWRYRPPTGGSPTGSSPTGSSPTPVQ